MSLELINNLYEQINKLEINGRYGLPESLLLPSNDRPYWVDSEVYRLGPYVIKEYSVLPLEKIEFYRDVTNAAAEIDVSEVIAGMPLSVKVNPILAVGVESDTQNPIAVSKYIPGVQLRDAMPMLSDDSNGVLDKLPVKPIIILIDLSIFLKRKLNTCGINLHLGNIKVGEESGLVVFTITDLCTRISLLKTKERLWQE